MTDIETLSVGFFDTGKLTCMCGNTLGQAPYYLIIVNENRKKVLCSRDKTCSCGVMTPMVFYTFKQADETIDLILSVKDGLEVTIANTETT